MPEVLSFNPAFGLSAVLTIRLALLPLSISSFNPAFGLSAVLTPVPMSTYGWKQGGFNPAFGLSAVLT